MYVSELRLFDFRQFKSVDGKPGLEVRFHPGLNALVGENGSGKTTVVDAMRYVLLTQSGEFVRPTEDDFSVLADGTFARELRIECVIAGLGANEAKNFIEYLTVEGQGEEACYYLRLYYRAWREGVRVFTDLRVGDRSDGAKLDGRARDLLRVVYLKPLRDAEREMSAGRRSRLSQILLSHPAFRDRDGHPMVTAFDGANQEIEKYFSENPSGKEVMGTIRSNLSAFHGSADDREASIRVLDAQLRSILESLSLTVGKANPGLGELNLLFMAAELLLLKASEEGGMRTALIEELEAHLHPQAQLRLIGFLQRDYGDHGSQVIVTTHSPVLASKINLKSLILLKGGAGFDMAPGRTKLSLGDYLFLQRFLDATKANLFFAKGVIMVEGDAENILIPALADAIGCPLERHGVSIVNVGSTAFLRYAGIMSRADGRSMGVPVSVVTDCDIKPYDVDEKTKEHHFRAKPQESHQAVVRKEGYYRTRCGAGVRAFVSPRWTLEYCLALSCLREDLLRAIHYAKKIRNSDANPLDAEKTRAADESAKKAWEDIQSLDSDEERAYRIYDMMLDGSGKSKLKAVVAQCLASMMRFDASDVPAGHGREYMFDLDILQASPNNAKTNKAKQKLEEDPYIRYLVNAIRHACGLQPITERTDG
jgi:putative ATP-dependent endonuclease of OLD family